MADLKKTVEYIVKLDGKISSSFKKLEKSLAKVDKQVNEVNKATIKPKVDNKSKKGVDGLSKSFGGLTDSLKGTLAGLSPIGAEFAAIAGPIGIAAAAVASLGTVLFSTASEISEVRKGLRLLGSDKEVADVTSEVRALQKTFSDLDSKELAKAAVTLKKTFGITGAESVEKLRQVLIATNGEVDLDNLTEYSSIVKQAGQDVEFLTKNIAFSKVEGFYQDKGIDAFKNFSEKILELPKASKEALKAVGIDGEKLRKQIETGAISTEQAYKKVFGNLTKFSGEQQRKLQASLTESAGLDIGAEALEKLANNTKSTKELAEAQKELSKVYERNNRLTTAQENATGRLIPVIKAVDAIWSEIQISFFKIMEPLTEMFEAIGKLIIESNEFKIIMFLLKRSWDNIVMQLKLAFNTITFIVNLVRGLSRILNEKLLASFKKIKEIVVDIFGEERIKKWKNGITSAITFVKGIWQSFAKSVSNLFERVANFANGNGFVVNAISSPGEESKTDSTTTSSKATAALANTNQKLMNNAVSSTTQAEVKSISITIDKLQEIGTQNITGQNVDQFKEQLQQVLVSIIADTSQL